MGQGDGSSVPMPGQENRPLVPHSSQLSEPRVDEGACVVAHAVDAEKDD